MEQGTANLDQIIRLADMLQKYWNENNTAAVVDLVRSAKRDVVNQIIFALLSDLEAATSR